MKITAVLLVMPLITNAHVNRCVDSDNKITFTESACTNIGKRSSPDGKAPLPAFPSSAPRTLPKKTGEQSPSDRLATIRLMLNTGKLSQARQFARTEQERALVREMDRGHAPDPKTLSRARKE